jgi:hypothetical protein
MALIGGGAAAKVAEALPMNVERSFSLDDMGTACEPQETPLLPDWWRKLDRENNMREERKYLTTFDLDLQANRSMSRAAKSIIQYRRDKARRSWLDKMREKAMKEIGLNS